MTLLNSDKPVMNYSFSERLNPILIVALMLCLIGVAGAPAQTPLELSEQELAWLRAHPVINVAATPDWPPFEFVDKAGRYKGVTIDFLAWLQDE